MRTGSGKQVVLRDNGMRWKREGDLAIDIFMYAFSYGLTNSFENIEKITHILYKCI